MKNTFLYLLSFILILFSINNKLQASTVDLSNCNGHSSFAIVTQSEGPTYACGGIDTGVGNPINVLNGNKFEQIDDFKAPPAFEGLSFSRYYNSHSQASTPMGYGWYSSFDIKLYEQPDIIQIRLETGKRINFKKTKILMQGQGYVIRGLAQDPKDGWVERRINGSGWIWHKVQTNYHFEASNKDPQLAHLIQVRSEKEAIYNLRYDAQDRLTHVENNRGDALNWRYTLTKYGLPQITVSTPLGDYQYFLDRNQNLVQVVYPNGKRFKYSYEPVYQSGNQHSLTGKWILEGTHWKKLSEWHYDDKNRAILSQHTEGLERVQISYDQTVENTAQKLSPIYKNIVTNALGKQTTYSYRIMGTRYYLLEVRGAGCPSCHTLNKSYQYDQQGNITSVLDLSTAQGLSFKYDDSGHLISRTTLDHGKALSTTDYRYTNIPSTFGEAQVKLAQETRNSVLIGQHYQKNYTYNASGQLTQITETGFSPLGDKINRQKNYGYDALGRLSWERGSNHAEYRYDGDSHRIAQIIYPNNLHLEFKYDRLGQIIYYRDLDGKSYKIAYDVEGNITQIDTYQGTMQLTYTQTGQIKSILNNLGQKIQFTYDNNQQLASIADQQNNQIKLIKNNEGVVTQAQLLTPTGDIDQRHDFSQPEQKQASTSIDQSTTRPNLPSRTLTDLQGMIASTADLNWQRPIQEEKPIDGQGRITRYQYNDFGDLVQVISPVTGTTRYQYNDQSLIIGQTLTDGSQTHYIRDQAGRITEIIARNAKQQEDEHGYIVWGEHNKPIQMRYRAGEERFKYNDQGQILEHQYLIDGLNKTIHYQYNQFGQLIEKTLPNQEKLLYQYRTATEAKAGLLASIQLKKGFLTQTIVGGLNTAQDTYSKHGYYFGNGLIHQTRKDKYGNIINSGNPYTGEITWVDDERYKTSQKTTLGQTVPLQHPIRFSQKLINLLDPIQTVQTILPLPNLNRKTQVLHQQVNYGAQFDALGRQRWLDDDGRMLFFSYDSLNRLNKVDTLQDGHQVTIASYQYNLFGQRLKKTTTQTIGKTAKTTYSFYDGQVLVAEADAKGAIEKSYVWMNQTPVAMIDQGELYYVHVDHRDAPIALTDRNRKVVWQVQLSDYLYASPTTNNRLGHVEFNLRGSNQYFDEETHLHYNTNRYFDAKHERYLTPDPLGLAAGPNLYDFALRQPHQLKDSLGLAPEFKDKTFADKFFIAIKVAVTSLPSSMAEVGQELLNFVSSDTTLKATAIIFSTWAALHLIGVGEAVDAFVVAAAAQALPIFALYGAFQLG
ncbi:RHS repeat protein [Acinetobacter sp. B5B]|nr:RHS repeat protein [Acinetobacter baretiae]